MIKAVFNYTWGLGSNKIRILGPDTNCMYVCIPATNTCDCAGKQPRQVHAFGEQYTYLGYVLHFGMSLIIVNTRLIIIT